jgi:hypothetical protein
MSKDRCKELCSTGSIDGLVMLGFIVLNLVAVYLEAEKWCNAVWWWVHVDTVAYHSLANSRNHFRLDVHFTYKRDHSERCSLLHALCWPQANLSRCSSSSEDR